jgi:hypothetical protein
MAQIDIEEEVVTDLKTLNSIKPAAVYHDGEVPMDDALPTTKGLVNPHVIVYPGSPSGSMAGRGIVGPQKDPVENYFIVEVVAPNRTITRTLGKAIDDHLFGKSYTGASQLRLGRATSWTLPEQSGAATPRTYHRAVLYRYITNL